MEHIRRFVRLKKQNTVHAYPERRFPAMNPETARNYCPLINYLLLTAGILFMLSEFFGGHLCYLVLNFI